VFGFLQKLNAMEISALLNSLPQIGQVQWISVRKQRNEPVQIVERVEAIVDKGLEGDHYQGRSGKREVTLIQAEHLTAVGALLRLDGPIDPALTRRNIVISGINLMALKDRQFKIGDAILEMTGDCHPCSKMEEHFGPGGYNAMRGHGGITARIIKGGQISIGDAVQLIRS
jgi:MOSC domain-containing protein YiiM